MSLLPLIDNLYSFLTQDEINAVIKKSTVFHDEPHYSLYITDIHPSAHKKETLHPNGEIISGAGLSFFSNELALVRSLGECVERYAASTFKGDAPSPQSFNQIQQKSNALDPMLYLQKESVRSTPFLWTSGYNLTAKTPIKIPLQLVNPIETKNIDPLYLTVFISSGFAGGVDKETTLLRGMYEVVERDASMTAWLTQRDIFPLRLETIPSKKLHHVLAQCHKYNFEVFVFNITNDLEIPVYMAFLIDKTGLGPALSVGTKAGINEEEVIISCIEEACMGRPWVRYALTKENISLNITSKAINGNRTRQLYWTPPSMLSHVSRFLRKKPLPFKIKKVIMHPKDELSMVVDTLKEKGFSIYTVDVTPENLRGTYTVLRVIIPGLQPLYLDEKFMVSKKLHPLSLNMKRLQAVSTFSGQKNLELNTIPHPYL